MNEQKSETNVVCVRKLFKEQSFCSDQDYKLTNLN
jgi:hypothetical protein